jgi:hypothetical protein
LQQHTTPTEAQRPPLFSFGEEVKVSFEPADSDWVISAAVRYGRSGNKMNVDHQTRGVHYAKYQSGVPAPTANIFTQEKFVNSQIYHTEAHSVMDFQAGKDVGLGLFGDDMSTLVSAGVRIAQYTSYSSVDVRARPDLHFKYEPSATDPNRFNIGPYFHSYHAYENASRKFRGVGPTISWSGSAPVFGDEKSGAIDFDWGANAAILFGRQEAKVQHHESGRYWPKLGLGLYTNSYRLYQKTGEGHRTNRNVTVPNLGGFAGISYRYSNAKISLGYRADFFFGAVDDGIDKRRSETLNMGGPFATVSFGLGG